MNKTPVQKPQTFGKWLENFWYHNKAITIGVVVAAILIGYGIYTTLSIPKYDLTVITATYGDSFTMPVNPDKSNFFLDPDEQKAKFEDRLKKYFYDADKNGEVNIDVRSIPVFNPNTPSSVNPPVSQESGSNNESSAITQETLSQLDVAQKQKLIANLRESEHIMLILDDVTYSLVKDTVKFENLEALYPDKEFIKDDKFYLKDSNLLEGSENNLQNAFICIRKLDDIRDKDKSEIKSLHEDIMKMVDDIIKNEN